MADLGFVVVAPVEGLLDSLTRYEPMADVVHVEGDGARAKNIATGGTGASIVGFVRAGAMVKRRISVRVLALFNDPAVAIVVSDGVFFVRRRWFVQAGRFDEELGAGWEEEDLIHRAEQAGAKVLRVDLPTTFDVPVAESKEDRNLVRHHHNKSVQVMQDRWGVDEFEYVQPAATYTDGI